MCQAFEGEQRYMFARERAERREKIRRQHKSGEQKLSDEELQSVVIDEFMARDAGY